MSEIVKGKNGRVTIDSMFPRLIRLARDGMTLGDIALELGVHIQSIYSFFGRHPNRKKVYDEVKAKATRELIERSLVKLGQGHSVTEETEEFIEERGDKVVKVKRKTTKLAPNIKALEALGNKYCPGEFTAKEESSTEIKLQITAEHRALSFEEKLGILLREKNGGEILELSQDDYKVEPSGRVELSEEKKKILENNS